MLCTRLCTITTNSSPKSRSIFRQMGLSRVPTRSICRATCSHALMKHAANNQRNLQLPTEAQPTNEQLPTTKANDVKYPLKKTDSAQSLERLLLEGRMSGGKTTAEHVAAAIKYHKEKYREKVSRLHAHRQQSKKDVPKKMAIQEKSRNSCKRPAGGIHPTSHFAQRRNGLAACGYRRAPRCV